MPDMEKENRPGAPKSRFRRRLLKGGLAGVGGLVLADALIFEPGSVVVETLALETDRLPPGHRLRLVQLSDLHIGRLESFHHHIVDRVRMLTPDVILHTGDYLEERRNIGEVLDFLGELKGLAPSFAVQGNWEYWSRLEGENLRRKFASRGVRLLINETADVGSGLRLLGLDYPSAADSLVRLTDRADRSRFNLLLSHVPAFEHRLLPPEIDLVLCGHTHGGQVRVPLIPPLYLPRYSGRFVSGLYRVGLHDTPLYVTRGLGCSILPMRLNCRPELTLIELAGRQSAS